MSFHSIFDAKMTWKSSFISLEQGELTRESQLTLRKPTDSTNVKLACFIWSCAFYVMFVHIYINTYIYIYVFIYVYIGTYMFVFFTHVSMNLKTNFGWVRL